MTNRFSGRALGALGLASALLLAGACSGGDDDSQASTAASATLADSTSSVTVAATEPAGPTTGGSGASTTDRAPVVVTLPPDTTPEPVRGGTFRYGVANELDGLNPTASALTAGLPMAAPVFDTLAAYDADGNVVPFLAESFTPNADATVWDVKLRSGITFHDGTALDAEAVRYNFAAQYDSPLVGLAIRNQYDSAAAAEVIDPLTVRFHLATPNRYWPAVMTTQLGIMASPTWIEAAKADPTLDQQPVGTGPFVFDSRTVDSVTRYVRNDNWWNGDVYLDAVEIYPVPDAATREDLLLNGDLDGLQTLTPSSILELRDRDGYTMIQDDSSTESLFTLNTTAAPFDDLRVRQALALATPKQQYLDLVELGVTRSADQMFNPDSPYYNPDVHQAADDPAAAAELVAQYCAERGTETNPITNQPTCTDGKVNFQYQFSGPDVTYSRIADLMIEGWSSSFNVSPQELLSPQLITSVVLGQYNVALFASFGEPEPSLFAVWLSCNSIGALSLNFPRDCNPARDEDMRTAAATADEAERTRAFQDAVRLTNEDAGYIFLNHTMYASVYADNVHGVCDRTSPEGLPLKCQVGPVVWPTSVWLSD